MRIGLTGRLLALWAVVGLTCSELAAQTTADSYYVSQPSGMMPAGQDGAVQALFTTPAGGFTPGGQQGAYVDAYGNPVIVPASYAMGCGQGCATCPTGGCYDGCYGGCGYPGVDPVPANAYGPDQTGPHYFDVRAEAVYLKRDSTFGPIIDFTSDNIDGPRILSSGQLDYDYEPGFRIIGRYDLGPLSLVEFGYMGMYNAQASAVARDPDEGDPGFVPDLFSLFSQFGLNPANVGLPDGPMPQTERALQHSLYLESDLHTAEISYRRYWVGFSPRVTGTLLAGFRYTELDEDFHFFSIGGNGTDFMDYRVQARNRLAGFQTGGDVWVCLLQGLRVGAEGKVGIYNNREKVRTDVFSSPTIAAGANEFPNVPEIFRNNQVAFIAEASADVVVDLLPSWSVRAGCEVLFLNSIALAGENFNAGPPYPQQTFTPPNPRVPFFANQGDALYYGFHAGLEYIW